MSNKSPVPYNSSGGGLTFFTDIVKRLRLTWLLFIDNRVPLWVKSILPLAALYVISPIDLIPDVALGLGQLDDLGIIMLGIAMFIKLCPQDIVQDHIAELESGGTNDDDVVDTTYEIVDKD
jgi:uncharacterized membrane protein YkvA (DUF1232 family)